LTDRMYLAFQQCLDMSRRGASLKQCLDQFPQYADELEPLLVAAMGSAGSGGPVMSTEMRSRLRGWVLSEWDRQHQPRRRRWSFSLFSSRWAMATAAAVVMLMVVVGGAGTAAAAQDAIPGTTLYPVKQLEEEARLWITRSPEVKVVRYGDLVRERAQDLRLLAGRGDAEVVFHLDSAAGDNHGSAETPRWQLRCIIVAAGAVRVFLDGTRDFLRAEKGQIKSYLVVFGISKGILNGNPLFVLTTVQTSAYMCQNDVARIPIEIPLAA